MGHWEQFAKENREGRQIGRWFKLQTAVAVLGAAVLWTCLIFEILL